MCVVSMVMDHYRERWEPMRWITYPEPAITQEEVEEFRRLLDRAREYDKKHNQPDCELDEKRAALKKIAEEMGIDISFIDPPEKKHKHGLSAIAEKARDLGSNTLSTDYKK